MQADISQPAGFLRTSLEYEARQLSPFSPYPQYAGRFTLFLVPELISC